MSRIGNKHITLPAGVEVTVTEGNNVTVKGPKGELTRQFNTELTILIDGNVLSVTRPNDTKTIKMLHGTTRALLANMVEGVSQGFTRELEIIGVGYRANKQGDKIVLSLGYSHPIEVVAEPGIVIELPSQTEIKISGIDKQRVGEVAANIRKFRQPEPYKGKGIRYKGEQVRRKEGKKAGK
ncbi:MAG: 50S ribosomal protein L6 [Culicoidibacterales bacterium]